MFHNIFAMWSQLSLPRPPVQLRQNNLSVLQVNGCGQKAGGLRVVRFVYICVKKKYNKTWLSDFGAKRGVFWKWIEMADFLLYTEGRM